MDRARRQHAQRCEGPSLPDRCGRRGRSRVSRSAICAGRRRRDAPRFRTASRGTRSAEQFSFLGRRDDVPRVLACCDIAVLPSKAEGLPNAVLEYLAAGLPTVASRVGGNAEIIQDGKTGLLVPPEDPSALAEALLRLLRDPGFAASLGKNGREYVASEFSFQRMIENTDQLYTELLRSRGMRMSSGPRTGSASTGSAEDDGPRGDCRPHSPADDRSLGFLVRTRQVRSERLECARWSLVRSRQFFFSPELFPDCAPDCVSFFRRRRSRLSSGPSESASIAFDLLGYEAVDYGAEIDWHCDRVHGKRAPRKPWFQMNYLDFAEVGDSKVTWELNRHQHLVTLAKAYRLSWRPEICGGVISPVGALAREESVSHRNQLGQQPGSCVSQPVVDLGLFSAGGFSGAAHGISPAWLRSLAVSGRHIEKLSIHIFFSQYASAGRSGRAVFHRHAVPGDSGGAALATARLGNRAAGSRAAGPSRRAAFRAVDSITTSTPWISSCTLRCWLR